ncbi:hypothetical protein [Nostoc sp. FACHB-133]|uniref:hypothetical protein n=1 Tax=Nostoc sp. FACHB-133 TaxID=2692835 RepID=UPI001984500C|nr:hypothetical protein [Nostoc sp. FACHB-133]MBD2524735.1 hypothetical protein [Nostoc sp. FACHB-133]
MSQRSHFSLLNGLRHFKTKFNLNSCGLLAASGGEISLGGEKGNLRSRDLRRRIG